MKKVCLIFIAILICVLASKSYAVKVHSLNSKIFVAEVSEDKTYSVVQSGSVWNTVRFVEPSVPIWVSDDYIEKQGSHAVVTANRLNMRFLPKRTSKVLGVVTRGYRSPILDSKNGFSLILAPSAQRFSLLRDSSNSEANTVTKIEPESDRAMIAGNNSSKVDVGSKWQMPERRNVAEVDETVAKEYPVTQTAQPSVDSEPSRKVVANPATIGLSNDRANNVNLVAQQHRLAPGDTISLQVFGESDMSLSLVRIPQSGSVSFPLIGAVDVADKTTKEVESIVIEKIGTRVYS